jgi:hypothetical protein
MGTIVSIDASFMSDAMAYVGQLWSDFSLPIILLLGVPIGFWIITKAVGFIRRFTSTGGRRAV